MARLFKQVCRPHCSLSTHSNSSFPRSSRFVAATESRQRRSQGTWGISGLYVEADQVNASQSELEQHVSEWGEGSRLRVINSFDLVKDF